ncbi:MAG TPA: hypothetical protein VD790_09505 [Thermoleophilaceae bacterium]|nr:hypothetical protein [Thermoleophilaceae bacterium]
MKQLAALAALSTLALAAPADAAKPNLKATDVSAPPKTVAEYSEFKVRDTVKNVAKKKRAGASTVRYYLSTDAGRSLREREQSKTNPRTAVSDILLEGGRGVPALDPGEKSATKKKKPVKVRVPLGTLAREYFLLACADDRGDVKESKEADNCVVSKKVAVTPLPGPLQTVTFNDWLLDEPDAEEAENLAIYKPLACSPTPATGGALTLKRALANIDAFLKAKAPQGVQQFAQSPAYDDANKAETAAATAVLSESPGAALAALTRAHRLEPKEASHLVNTATLATAVGMPREALALLDASLRLDDKVPSSWGINRQAIQLTNRAHALAALGRFGEAETASEAAAAMEPSLTEPTATGSIAALCQNNMPKAVLKRKKARRRTPHPPRPIDESVGVEQPLRKLHLPGFPSQAESFQQYYDLQQQRLASDLDGQIERQNQLEAALRAKKVSRLTERQGNRLMSAFYAASDTPKLEAAWAAIGKQADELERYRKRFFCRDADCEPENHYYTQFSEEASDVCEGDPRTNCFEIELNARCRPALKSYHQGWLTRMEKQWTMMNAYHRAVSKRMSAAAANIGDPHRHALALLQIEMMEGDHYAWTMQEGGFWTHDIAVRGDHCVEIPEDPAIAPEDGEAAEGDPCTSKVKPFNVVLPLGPNAALKFSCEQIQFTANGEGWIRAFSEISYDYRAGKLTVFAGSQAEIGAIVKGDFKSGLYVTVTNQGFEDAGWRVGPGYTVGAGPAEYNPSDMVDISFVGIFSGGAQ